MTPHLAQTLLCAAVFTLAGIIGPYVAAQSAAGIARFWRDTISIGKSR